MAGVFDVLIGMVATHLYLVIASPVGRILGCPGSRRTTLSDIDILARQLFDTRAGTDLRDLMLAWPVSRALPIEGRERAVLRRKRTVVALGLGLLLAVSGAVMVPAAAGVTVAPSSANAIKVLDRVTQTYP